MPTDVTLFGIVIDVKLEQFSNAEVPIDVTLFGISIDVRLACQPKIGQKLFSRVRRSKLNWRKITKRAVNTIIIEPMNVISEF